MDRSVLIRLGLDPDRFNRGLMVASTHAKAFTKDLDSSNERMSWLVQSSLALGPALVPIGAAGVGAIAGLAVSLGAAAAGAGIAVFAFQGVGDALKALNDFSIDPTEAHLQKLHETLDEIGPAGGEFVLFLQQAQPEIERLQRVAQNGLLPGVQEGLSELLDMMPQVSDLVSSLASGIGGIAAEGGSALNSPFWKDFLAFVADDGRDAMVTMFRIIGNLTEGIAGLVQAFDPLSDDVGAGLLGQARAFAEWADELEDSQGFQSFLQYVHDVGPDAWQTLQAIGSALVSIVQAAAPVGAVSLPILEALADIISAIADSPVGPVLIAAAAGLSAISRAVALYNMTSGSALSGLLFGAAGKPGLLGANASQGAALRGTAAGIGILALSLTDLDESMGLSNTANFGLLGAIFGKRAGLIGAGIGLTKDFAAANDDLESSLRSVNDALANPIGFEQQNAALADFQSRIDQMNSDRTDFGAGTFSTQNIKNFFTPPWMDNDLEKAEKELDAATAAQDRYKESLNTFVNATRSASTPYQDLTDDTDALAAAAERTQPVLDKMGLSIEDVVRLQSGFGGGGPMWEAFLTQFSATATEMDSIPGRADLVAASFAALDDDIVSTTTSAEALQTALDALLSPQMDLEAATDAYAAALQHWDDDLAKSTRSLDGQTDGARKNRAALRDRVNLMTDMLTAEAAADATAEELTDSMRRQRQRLLETADAAGLNKDRVRELIREYGLVPSLIKTLILANTDQARNQARLLKEYIENLDPVMTVRMQHVESRLGIPGPYRGGWMSDYADAYGMAAGGSAAFRRRRGLLEGPGTTTSDDIAAMLSRKEFVTNAWATEKAGVDAMYRINAGAFDPRALRSVLGLAGGGSAWESGYRDTPRNYGNGSMSFNLPPTRLRMVEGRIDMRGGEPWFRGIVQEEIDASGDHNASVTRQGG